MTVLDEHGRPEPPVAADEVATLLGFLDYQRATLAWKCSGLEAAGLRATAAASTMTLGGILKHMALVECGWFSRSLHGREYAPPWDAVDWEADRDWEWHTAAEDSPEELPPEPEQPDRRAIQDGPGGAGLAVVCLPGPEADSQAVAVSGGLGVRAR